MNRYPLPFRPFVALVLLALGGCEGPTSPSAPEVEVTLGQSMTLRDGAAIDRQFVFERAAQDPASGALRYEARVDGVPRTLVYAPEDGALRILATGDGPETEVELYVTAAHAEFAIAGELVGHLPRAGAEPESVFSAAPADEHSFALLSVFPHAVEGLRPDQLFGDKPGASAQAGDDGPLGQVASALRIGPIKLGGASLNCKRNTTKLYSCESLCVQGPDGCACGSACGPIACCGGGCKVEERVEWTYGGSI